ncbi:H(+)-transporting V1 sector ATPase subunit F [Sugiyamaella lignohabitans]|uniref:H(+)-transporting V1 sector ATPase subunit F n=1 Tax=Sugiyamaella lignohabitans TaxID=796027 RepID=A0A167FMF4_9ASCO|nr:H(+)-transporting V1 sector ATPase subunit F [Sugiyamaella lignohabitans]ANB15479.1 H(+)-transporting V1 sector ATPase subunit F [Sugiyamaella lignohabitans]
MSSSTKAYKDRNFLAVIGDEDSVTGLLLAGIGHVSDNDGERTKNFLVVDAKTATEKIEKAFEEYTTREDIAVLLINQHVSLSDEY